MPPPGARPPARPKPRERPPLAPALPRSKAPAAGSLPGTRTRHAAAAPPPRAAANRSREAPRLVPVSGPRLAGSGRGRAGPGRGAARCGAVGAAPLWPQGAPARGAQVVVAAAVPDSLSLRPRPAPAARAAAAPRCLTGGAMASRKSPRGAGGSPGPGSKRGERRRCGSEAVALGVLPRGSLPGRSGAYRRGAAAAAPALGEGQGPIPPLAAAAAGSPRAKRGGAAPSSPPAPPGGLRCSLPRHPPALLPALGGAGLRSAGAAGAGRGGGGRRRRRRAQGQMAEVCPSRFRRCPSRDFTRRRNICLAGPRRWGRPSKASQKGWGERRAGRLPGAGLGISRYPGKVPSDLFLPKPGLGPGCPVSDASEAAVTLVFKFRCWSISSS